MVLTVNKRATAAALQNGEAKRSTRVRQHDTACIAQDRLVVHALRHLRPGGSADQECAKGGGERSHGLVVHDDAEGAEWRALLGLQNELVVAGRDALHADGMHVRLDAPGSDEFARCVE